MAWLRQTLTSGRLTDKDIAILLQESLPQPADLHLAKDGSIYVHYEQETSARDVLDRLNSLDPSSRNHTSIQPSPALGLLVRDQF